MYYFHIQVGVDFNKTPQVTKILLDTEDRAFESCVGDFSVTWMSTQGF